MKDLLVNFVGALTYSVFGYIYVKEREKHQEITRSAQIAENWMVRVADEQSERLEEPEG